MSDIAMQFFKKKKTWKNIFGKLFGLQVQSLKQFYVEATLKGNGQTSSFWNFPVIF